jgi:vacuolar-type H+-ATPase subunit C/Vma6
MYDYQIGIIRAKESELLKKTDYDRILGFLTLRDVWVELTRLNLGYKDINSNEMLENISKVYSENLKNLYLETVSFFKDEDINLKKSFLYEFDFYNLKLFYKQKIFGNNDFGNKFLDIGFIGLKKIEDYIKNENFIFEILDEKNIILSDIFDIVKNDKTTLAPLDFDFMLDRMLFDFRIKIATIENNDFLADFWKKSIDFYNLKIFLKDFENNDTLYIKNGFINIDNWINLKNLHEEEVINFMEDYGYKNLTKKAFLVVKEDFDSLEWEIEEESILLNLCERACFYSASIEPIISYFYRKSCEIKNLNRILFNRAFKKGIDSEIKISKNF